MHACVACLCSLYLMTGRPSAHAGAQQGAGTGELGMAAALEDDRDAFGAKKEADKVDRQQWRAQQREALDEMLPKATGRCARLTSSQMCTATVQLPHVHNAQTGSCA